jgi:hypothetical protein
MGEEQILSDNSSAMGEITLVGKFANLISMAEVLFSETEPEDLVRLIAEKVKEVFSTSKAIIYLEDQRLPGNKICWWSWDITPIAGIEAIMEKACPKVCTSSEVVIVGESDILKAEDDSISSLLSEARSIDNSIKRLVCIPPSAERSASRSSDIVL